MEIKITYPNERTENRTVVNVALGFFTGEIGGCSGLFLRTFEEAVFVSEPVNTWGPDALVQNYKPVSVEIRVL